VNSWRAGVSANETYYDVGTVPNRLPIGWAQRNEVFVGGDKKLNIISNQNLANALRDILAVSAKRNSGV